MARRSWTKKWNQNGLRLCGTKLGCAEGGCGACTVMVSRVDRATGELQHMAVNACLAPVCSLHGLAVTTVEGIGSTKTTLHPVQQRLALSHGSQCGFCTPGNLCRCTGYRPIIEGFKSFLEDWEVKRVTNGSCAPTSNGFCEPKNGQECCKKAGGCCKTREIAETTSDATFTQYDPSQEPIFPSELQMSDDRDREFLKIKGERMTWFRPQTLHELLCLKAEFPNARIAVGNTEVGVEVKFKNCFYEVIIQPSQVRELTSVEITTSGVKLGAAVTLNDMEHTLRSQISTQPEHKTRIFLAIADMLDLFAGKQIRNVAGIGGNIMTGSPISDLNPIFLTAGVTLEVHSKERGVRSVIMNHEFFTGYRRNVVKQDEILVSILVPYTSENEYFVAYKQAKRRDDDIAIVNAALKVKFESTSSDKIAAMSMAFGGMAPTTVMAVKTSNALQGRDWDETTLDEAYNLLMNELPLSPEAPGGMVQFRRALTLSFMLKFYLSVCEQRGRAVRSELRSAAQQFRSELPTHSAQYFELVPHGQVPHDLVGRTIPHKSAMKQATGEAVYVDDIPPMQDELYLALVLSTRAHAKLRSVDASKALALPGVVLFLSAKDLEGGTRNQHGTIKHDEEVFVSQTVTAQGQVIGAVVAENQMLAQRAAKLVTVEYEDLQPIIVTIEDAIVANSFHEGFSPRIECGDVSRGFADSKHVLYGETRTGGQEHFYLETHCTQAVPRNEDHEMEIYCSTQNPAEVQRAVAEMLEIPHNRVVCHVKRLGGGFGGKESRSCMIALPVALAAYKLGRAVRCMLDRDEDMVMTGGRNPFLARYKVGFSDSGRINACQMTLYNNAGNTLDLSCSVMDRAVFHMENSYKIPNVDAQGYVCRTNLPSNTAFRGFGGPQGMFMAENFIEDIAATLKMDPAEVRRLNLYQEGDETHYGQKLEHCTLQRCWDECVQRSSYTERRGDIEQYNRQNRFKKRGICIVPTKFGIAFTTKFLNQTGCLVHVYLDGSVLISHGGVEMGQGLHTKMIQVASRALGVPEVDIHVGETATDKVPNTSPSAASATSDLNGMAILPYKKANPKGSWKKWISAAYLDRVSLTPDIGFDWKTRTGKPFNYFTYGVACSEVEIDCLTGDHKVLRTDIVMDLGESINPSIDIGQIEGGFIQGYGLFTLEEVVYSPKGTLYSRGPGAYKLPGFADIPLEFNLHLCSLPLNMQYHLLDLMQDSMVHSDWMPLQQQQESLPEAKPGTFTPWNTEP
ncbi:hypothetical protein B566_EDAN016934 [Ephemera danica]|nr:hypothetical protein B566_EDAN016934 [Ephemera danica]